VALGYLYAEKRSLDEAKEAFSFAASLAKDDATAPYALAEMLDKAGRAAEAFGWYKKALAVEPNSPRYLTSVIESALELKDADTAESALAVLSEVNPQNKKIRDYAVDLEELLADTPKKTVKKKK
jgi:Flp pilus assembly protein TadD